jgi:hypothetical protein
VSILAKNRIHGTPVRITRPVATTHADGSRTRAGASGSGVELYASVRVMLGTLTTERRAQVFGDSATATETVRVPIAWGLQEGDQLAVLAGPEAGRRFVIEKTIAYRERARISHTECALVALPVGAA